MWKAGGGEEAKRPVHWQRSGPGQDFIEFITATYKLKQDYVWEARRGKHGGGTWAHWQIVFARTAGFGILAGLIVASHIG